MVLAFMPVITAVTFAAEVVNNYEDRSGPDSNAYINLNDLEADGNPTEIYSSGKNYSGVIDGVAYDKAANTLTFDNFVRPDLELAMAAMGDDFTLEVRGICEIGCITVLGRSGTDSQGLPWYYGGSLNIKGAGTLTVNKDRTADWGIEFDEFECGSTLNIDRNVSLNVYGRTTLSDPDLHASAVCMIGSSVLKSEEAITIDEGNGVRKALDKVYPRYITDGFQHPDEPGNLKDYWIDCTKDGDSDPSNFQIKGEGITDIDGAEVVLEEEYIEYTGKAIEPVIKTIDGFTLTKGDDYSIIYSPSPTVDARNYTIYITGEGKFRGKTSTSFTIFPDSGSTKAKAVGKTIALKYKNLKKKNLSVVKSKYVKVGSDQGTISYKITSAKKGTKNFKKSFSISKSSGKITVKKKLKKGTYTLKVKVTAKGNSNYKVTGSKTITVKIKVK